MAELLRFCVLGAGAFEAGFTGGAGCSAEPPRFFAVDAVFAATLAGLAGTDGAGGAERGGLAGDDLGMLAGRGAGADRVISRLPIVSLAGGLAARLAGARGASRRSIGTG